MAPRGGIDQTARNGSRWNGDRWSEGDGGGRTYYDVAPGVVPVAPDAGGGYCNYVDSNYDVWVGGDGC